MKEYIKISPDIKKRANEQGLDLKAEDKYFKKVTREIAKAALNKCWNHISQKLKKK